MTSPTSPAMPGTAHCLIGGRYSTIVCGRALLVNRIEESSRFVTTRITRTSSNSDWYRCHEIAEPIDRPTNTQSSIWAKSFMPPGSEILFRKSSENTRKQGPS